MPYIDYETQIEEPNYIVDELIDLIREFPLSDRDGICNYVVSRVVAGSMRPAEGWRYRNLARAYAVFMAAGAEFYRRLLSPYEDKCIDKNGDIPEYRNALK